MSRRRRTTVHLPGGHEVHHVVVEGAGRGGAPVTVRIFARRVTIGGLIASAVRVVRAEAPSAAYLCELLAQVDREVPVHCAERWTAHQRREAESWAAARVLRTKDQPVEELEEPEHVHPFVVPKKGDPNGPRYYLISLPNSAGYEICFWRPRGAGYTIFVEAAGRYTAEEARASLDPENTIAVPCERIDDLERRVVHLDELTALTAHALRAEAHAS